ncbi:Domain of uncharacterised function (DUF2825) [Corynebacterium striatum]|nr:Domain of uncharacterised function (DUF2825) [Corynebacterium striatum]
MRLIPAYAGRTWAWFRCWRSCGAHPRLRGADVLISGGYPGRWGSSPLTRGGRVMSARVLGMVRLIPAYAGRTLITAFPELLLGAHPRLRGADPGLASARRRFRGSSPLTRGGRETAPEQSTPAGLIPAYAGRTYSMIGFFAPERAHPRLRGADVMLFSPSSVTWGSSPLTRGGRALDDAAEALNGLIPAYAGRTRWSLPNQPTGGAHPRLRGADLMRCGASARCNGSSPLTRGGLAWLGKLHEVTGLIPAYAGRTAPQPRFAP